MSLTSLVPHLPELRVRIRSPTPDWECRVRRRSQSPSTEEDVLLSPLQERSAMTGAERQSRRRAINKGRRKEGKRAVERRKREVLGRESRIDSPFGLKNAVREIGLDPRQVERETGEIDVLLDYLGSLDPLPGRLPLPPVERHELVRRVILERLALALDAEEAAVHRKGGRCTSNAYLARRIVAGWGQLLDLWDYGEENSLMRASEHGALIFRGARFNTNGVRDRLSMYCASK